MNYDHVRDVLDRTATRPLVAFRCPNTKRMGDGKGGFAARGIAHRW